MSLDVPSPRSPKPLTVGVAILLVFLLGLTVGVVIDRSRGDVWKSGRAHVGERQVSIESDGWTYGAEGSIPAWIDMRGTRHDGGWPGCLDGRVGSTRTVRFLAPNVDFDGGSIRPIVVVDCRG